MAAGNRTANVIAVAGELFLARGFEGVTIGMIVAKTGGSFRDVYREFGSKQDLFLRVMHDLCDEVIAPVDDANPSQNEDLLRPVEQVLAIAGRRILEALLSPRLLALHRLILNEAKRFPALGQRWYEAGPNRANRTVAAILTSYIERGIVQPKDPCLLAAVFLDSLINNLQMRALTGIPVPAADIEQRVSTCVEIFLNGVREGQ